MSDIIYFIEQFFRGYEISAIIIIIIAFGVLIYKMDRWIVRYRTQNLILEELEYRKKQRRQETQTKSMILDTQKETMDENDYQH